MRQALLILAAAALAVGVSACGGAGGAFTFDPVAKAATKTLHARSSKIKIVGDVTGQRRSVHLVGGGVETDDGIDLTFFADPFGSHSLTLHEIGVTQAGDTVLYMSIPEATSQLPSGKKWVRMDVDKEAKKRFGVDPSQLSPAGAQNAHQSLELLKGPGVTSSRKVGAETVDGNATMHYHVVVDIPKAMKAVGASAAGMREIRRVFGNGTMPIDVWVDKSGYVHQLRMSYRLGRARVTFTETMSDFGVPVSIKAPPADETIDAEKLLGSS
jgi:hypothetical protein